MARRRRVIGGLCLALVLATPPVASAQDPAAIQRAVNTGQRLLAEGRPVEATPLLAQAARDAEALWGDGSPDAGTLTILWADAVTAEGRLAEGEALYRRALDMLGRSAPPGDMRTALALNNFAINLIDQGRYAEAVEALDRALAIRVAVQGEAGPAVLVSLNNRAIALKGQGDFVGADALYRRILAARRGPDDPETAMTLNNLGANLLALNRTTEAEAALRRAADLRERFLGADHPLTAQTLTHLADALAAQGRTAAAEAMKRRALTALEAEGRPVAVAAGLTGLAQLVLAREGGAEEAEALIRRALALRRTALGPDHPETLDAQTALGDVLLQSGRAAEARTLLAATVEASERRLGSGHPGLIAPLFLLALAEGEADDRAAAIRRLRQADALAAANLPPTHLARIGARANLGAALAADRRPDEALPLLRQAGADLIAKAGARRGGEGETRRDLDAYRHVYRLTVTAAWDRAAAGS